MLLISALAGRGLFTWPQAMEIDWWELQVIADAVKRIVELEQAEFSTSSLPQSADAETSMDNLLDRMESL